MKANHIHIENRTTLNDGEECMTIRIELDNCQVGSIDPGQSFDIMMPVGTKLKIRESISCGVRKENGVVKGIHVVPKTP